MAAEFQARLTNLETHVGSLSAVPDRLTQLEQSNGLMGTQLREFERQQDKWKNKVEHVISDLIPKLQEFETQQRVQNVQVDTTMQGYQTASNAISTQVGDLATQVQGLQKSAGTSRLQINDLDSRAKSLLGEVSTLSDE